MDPEIKELKELVRQNIALTQENTKMLHSMRRSQRMRTMASFLWWLIILAVSAYSYYYFLAPYVTKLEALYGQVQSGGQQAHSIEQQVQQYINQFVGQSATSTR